MKPIALIGVVLIVLGIGALAYQGFSYTSREKIIDLGPIQASADTEKTVSIPPIAGGAAVLVGVVLLLAGSRKNS
jgi:uncharacterized membrane protein YidH (DUF202 family)